MISICRRRLLPDSSTTCIPRGMYTLVMSNSVLSIAMLMVSYCCCCMPSSTILVCKFRLPGSRKLNQGLPNLIGRWLPSGQPSITIWLPNNDWWLPNNDWWLPNSARHKMYLTNIWRVNSKSTTVTFICM